jgi:hypothetical protein
LGRQPGLPPPGRRSAPAFTRAGRELHVVGVVGPGRRGGLRYGP